MTIITGISIILGLFTLSNAPFQNETLNNGQTMVVISPVQTASRAGTVLEFVDLQTGVDFAEGGNYGSVQCGNFVPRNGTLIKYSASHATFVSPEMYNPFTTEELPIVLTVDYRLVGRGMEITYTVTAADTAELMVPMEADFGLKPYLYGHLMFKNQTILNDRQTWLNGNHTAVFRISGDQEIYLHCADSLDYPNMVYLFPNPSKAFIALSAEEFPENEILSMRFFDTEPPWLDCQGPDTHSMLGPGNTSTYYVRMGIQSSVVPIYFSNHPNMFERTASCIFDDIPLVHPPIGYVWSFSETSSGPEWISAWLIQLLEAHPALKMNIVILADAILDANCDSMWFEPWYEESWSHWHSTWRISTEATEEFKQWMINIQNDAYPWADQVNLGCIGYHHTPSPDSAWDPFHEFVTFEPVEHQERFDVIFDDYTAIGINAQDAMRTVRPAGNKTSLSGLWAMIDHGVKFYSNGARWSYWVAGEWFYDLFLTKYETPNGRIWGANTVWLADWDQMMEYEKLSTVMERGKHGLLGGHPIDMFGWGTQVAYDRMDSIFTSLEEDYSHFGWIMPVDYANMMEECYISSVDSIRSTVGSASIYFTGSTNFGQTIVCRLPNDYSTLEVTLDDQVISWEDYGDNRIFVDVNGLEDNSHVVNLVWQIVGIETDDNIYINPISINLPNPTGLSVIVTLQGLNPEGSCELNVLDMSGRCIITDLPQVGSSGSATVDLNLPDNTPPGVYFIRIQDSGQFASRKLVLLRQ